MTKHEINKIIHEIREHDITIPKGHVLGFVKLAISWWRRGKNAGLLEAEDVFREVYEQTDCCPVCEQCAVYVPGTRHPEYVESMTEINEDETDG